MLAINPSHDESERTLSAAASQALGAAFFGMIACFAVAAVLSVGAAVVGLLRRIADGK
jgi:hypothetical protein